MMDLKPQIDAKTVTQAIAIVFYSSSVHNIEMRIAKPKKIPTPYGGRLIWKLPGGNVIIAHLKDKAKIRHRKRWSQVRERQAL